MIVLSIPHRIVSPAPSKTEIHYALGLGDRVVAVTSDCDYPPEARAKPKVGSWIKIDDELVARHRPDLILTSTIVQGAAEVRYQAQGHPIAHVDPTTRAHVYASIHAIGRRTGVRSGLSALLRTCVWSLPRSPQPSPLTGASHALVIEAWHKLPSISGNWVPDMVAAAGGAYSILPAGQYSHPIHTEEVAAFDPEIIVLSLCGLAHRAKAAIITNRAGWQAISAVRHGRIYVADHALFNRPGPRLVVGIRWLETCIWN